MQHQAHAIVCGCAHNRALVRIGHCNPDGVKVLVHRVGESLTYMCMTCGCTTLMTYNTQSTQNTQPTMRA